MAELSSMRSHPPPSTSHFTELGVRFGIRRELLHPDQRVVDLGLQLSEVLDVEHAQHGRSPVEEGVSREETKRKVRGLMV